MRNETDRRRGGQAHISLSTAGMCIGDCWRTSQRSTGKQVRMTIKNKRMKEKRKKENELGCQVIQNTGTKESVGCHLTGTCDLIGGEPDCLRLPKVLTGYECSVHWQPACLPDTSTRVQYWQLMLTISSSLDITHTLMIDQIQEYFSGLCLYTPSKEYVLVQPHWLLTLIGPTQKCRS